MDGLGLYRRSGCGTVLWPALTDLLPLSSALVMLSCGDCSVHPEEYEYCDSGSVCCEGLVMCVLLCCCHFSRTENMLQGWTLMNVVFGVGSVSNATT